MPSSANRLRNIILPFRLSSRGVAVSVCVLQIGVQQWRPSESGCGRGGMNESRLFVNVATLDVELFVFNTVVGKFC
jgi:hypothetical protein